MRDCMCALFLMPTLLAMGVADPELLAVEARGDLADEGGCCAMGAAAANVRPFPAPGSPIVRLRAEGIRAMSSGDPEKMAAERFNLVLPWEQVLRGAKKTSPPDSPIILNADDFSEKSVARLRDWALKCKQNDLIMMYMMYVAAESSVRYLTGLDGNLLTYVQTGEGVKKRWPAHEYRHVVDWHGRTARWAPCPLEQRYWLGFIRPQLELVARVLKETGVSGGGALELETYCFYSIYPGMASQKATYCYCDHCYYGFVGALVETRVPQAVRPENRYDWLTQRGLRARYEAYLEDCLAGLVEEMIRKVRQVNPDFLFGMYPYAPFWYYDALIRGSGTPELPCLLFASPEYRGGYAAETPITFFGDAPTPASVAHLLRRELPAMYAGGLWAKNIASPDAVATAMDRMLRGPDGYWIYNDYGHTNEVVPEQLWRKAGRMNAWTTAHPGPLPAGEMKVDALAAAIERLAAQHVEGITAGAGRIVARYEGPGEGIHLRGAGFEDEENAEAGWAGRGALPSLDRSVSHAGNASLRFDPSTPSDRPRSPYIDRKVPEAVRENDYELSFWTRVASDGEPVRFWVGWADSDQYPGYMLYDNCVLPPDEVWKRLRIGVDYDGSPPLVIRFWCPPTDGKVWLDDVTLRPVQPRTIEIPIRPLAGSVDWGSIDWAFSPADARCEATIVDIEDGHRLRTRLYPGDSLAPLAAILDRKPVMLRLRVYPSAAEAVVLDRVEVRFTTQTR